VIAKLETQLRYLLRATRSEEGRGDHVERICERIRDALRRAAHAPAADALLGHEGTGAAAYFEGLPFMLAAELDERFRFDGRNRQPPRDRVNAILGFAYGMLYREVLQAIVAVGLHPGVGFYHRPRSAAHPLALDLMELFRVPVVDMAVIPALNRRTFDPVDDFRELPGRVLLSDTGRRKVVEVIERRKADTWRHSVVGYSLSYARLIELEVRLLEKEWMGEGGLFAKFRLR
jgi:CRISP-associated protein Cas1